MRLKGKSLMTIYNWSEDILTLHFSVLASGSTGNCVFIESDSHQYLIDAGLSGKQIERKLDLIGKRIEDISGIFVTHEHIDHVKGLGVLARKYEMPLYMNEATFRAMPSTVGEIPVDCLNLIVSEKDYHFGDLDILPFHISHDAAEPFGYVFAKGEKKFTYLTDTGYVSQRAKEIVQGSNAYIFESNHDIRLLQMGRYPWHVKQRILGDAGHLSNEDSAVALSEIVSEKTEHIYLAHLSKEHNMKELALSICDEILFSRRQALKGQIQLHMTDPDEPTQLLKI